MHNTQTAMGRVLCLRLMRYAAPYWDALILAFACLIAMAATVPLLAALVEPMLDGAIIDRSPDLMQLIPLGIIALFIVRGVAGQVGVYAISWAGNRLALDMRMEMFSKLMSLPARHVRYPGINPSSLITTRTTRIARAFIDVSTVLVRDSFTVAGLLAWAFYLSWMLASLTLSMALAFLLIRRLATVRMRDMGAEAEGAMKDLDQVVKDSVENYLVVKLHAAEQYECRRVKEQAEDMRRFVMKRTTLATLWIPVIQLGAAVALAAIVYLAAQQASANEITAGAFASLAASMLLLIAPLKRMAAVSEILRRGLVDADSLFSLLDRESERDIGTIEIHRAQGELRFEGVGYCEEHEENGKDVPNGEGGANTRPETGHCPLLQDVTLTVRPGETAALVGFPESTVVLASMVPRFVEPTSGRVLLDGHDLRNLRLTSLRANIALVSGETVLFNDTIAANIAYGMTEHATEATITAAAHAAHVSEFLRKMPQGLQTLVGEGGVELDRGQRLRIVIARALLKDAPILILDEPSRTGNDTVCSYHVQAALDAIMQGRTTLVIARCLRTVEKAHRIVVLEKGHVVSTGSHRELLLRDRKYARFIRALGVSESADMLA